MADTQLCYLIVALVIAHHAEAECTSNCWCNGDVCTSCKVGYFHTTSNPPCSNECQASCKTCEGYSNCQSCNDNYYIYIGRYCISCPTNCALCTTYGTCTQCEEGWTNGGSITNCAISCPTQCTDCSASNVCTSCKSGWYGPTCASECQESCAGSCDKVTGDCDECVPGRYGRLCQYYCPVLCSSTTCDKDTGNCLTCPSTSYGPQCQYRCSPLCDGQLCGEDGACTSCPDGKYGQHCSSDCTGGCIKCDQQTGACDSDTQCQTGYYGDYCDMVCQRCQSSCDKQSGACHVCEDGYTGSNCDNQCNPKCKVCYRNTANACSACVHNRYGYSSSQYNCNDMCSSQCLVETCNDITGKCHACQDGYAGDQCNIQCNAKCKACDQLDPNSCTACSDNTYGYENNMYMCEHQCSTNCKDGQCDDQTGDCSQGCIAGYAGQKCFCPENCNCEGTDGTVCTSCKDGTPNTEGNCACSTALCSDASCTSCSHSSYYGTGSGCCLCSQRCKYQQCVSQDVCSNGCENGFYKSDCSGTCTDIDQRCEICSSDQQSRYVSCLKCETGYFPNDTGICEPCSNACLNLKCDAETGDCLDGCYSPMWGGRCENSCSRDCKNDCQQMDGICTACVNDTVHGYFCNLSCGIGCINNKCQRTTAECLNGCENKYYGVNCDLECSNTCASVESKVRRCSEGTGTCFECMKGFYGYQCTFECSLACVNKTCGQESGRCTHGCREGFKQDGTACLKVQAATGEDKETGGLGAIIGGSIAGGVAIVAVIVAICVIIKRRKSISNGLQGGVAKGNTHVDTNAPMAMNQIVPDSPRNGSDEDISRLYEDINVNNSGDTNGYSTLGNINHKAQQGARLSTATATTDIATGSATTVTATYSNVTHDYEVPAEPQLPQRPR